MPIKIYAYLAGALLFVAVLWWVDNNGYKRAEADQQAAERAQLLADADAVEDIKIEEKERVKVVVKYKTIIKESGDCFTKPLNPKHTAKLRDAYNAITRSKANGAVQAGADSR